MSDLFPSAPLRQVPPPAPRPCERKCDVCHEWKHYSRFRAWKRSEAERGRYRSVSATICFSPTCKACEQKIRNEKKNADRPLAIIQNRARAAAAKAGASYDFFWIEMNYQSLVTDFRGLMTPEARCKCCGHAFLNERDIQIEHMVPPRDARDWANLHTRNLRLCCASCNGKKGKKSFQEWLDEEEDARVSNRADRTRRRPEEYQPDLFASASEAAE